MQVLRVGAAEGVDGLGVVARRRSGTCTSGCSSRTMSACTAFTSWYSSTSTASNMPRASSPAAGSASARPPQQQQVIEVDQRVAALVRDVPAEQARQRWPV